jgi:hypothetical protein
MTGYPLPLRNDLQNSRQSATTKASRDHERTKPFRRINLACQETINLLNLTLKTPKENEDGPYFIPTIVNSVTSANYNAKLDHKRSVFIENSTKQNSPLQTTVKLNTPKNTVMLEAYLRSVTVWIIPLLCPALQNQMLIQKQ